MAVAEAVAAANAVSSRAVKPILIRLRHFGRSRPFPLLQILFGSVERKVQAQDVHARFAHETERWVVGVLRD